MAVKIVNGYIEYQGLSSDTKPQSAQTGARFLETDTQKWFIFDGVETWYEVPAEVAERSE